VLPPRHIPHIVGRLLLLVASLHFAAAMAASGSFSSDVQSGLQSLTLQTRVALVSADNSFKTALQRDLDTWTGQIIQWPTTTAKGITFKEPNETIQQGK